MAAPTIKQILNNSSGTPPGLPNYGIAPSSIFIVTGSGLSDAGDPVLQDSSLGLPLTLKGASISVTVGGGREPGVTTHPAMYYASHTQIAAVLPAATPVGTGTLTVTYNGVSAEASIQVVASAVGINQYNQIPIPLGKFNPNVDLGVATDAITGALISFTNSGAPGQIITLWATGLGADPADSDTTLIATPHAVNTPLQIYLGGVLADILYQGSSAYPGVNQINLTIPNLVITGCYVPLVAVTGTIISNVVVLPIHEGGGTCVEPQSGGGTVTGDEILRDTQDTLKGGVLTLTQSDSSNGSDLTTMTAGFAKISGLLAGAVGRAAIISPGGCWVAPTVSGAALSPVYLDAGSITVSGPAGLSLTLTPQIKGEYNKTLATAAIPSSGGSFTYTGSGGADVGPFTSTLTFSNPIFNWTNQSSVATVDRTKGLLFTWTGGKPGTYVLIQRNIQLNSRRHESGSERRLRVPCGRGSRAIHSAVLYSARHAGRQRNLGCRTV